MGKYVCFNVSFEPFIKWLYFVSDPTDTTSTAATTPTTTPSSTSGSTKPSSTRTTTPKTGAVNAVSYSLCRTCFIFLIENIAVV